MPDHEGDRPVQPKGRFVEVLEHVEVEEAVRLGLLDPRATGGEEGERRGAMLGEAVDEVGVVEGDVEGDGLRAAGARVGVAPEGLLPGLALGLGLLQRLEVEEAVGVEGEHGVARAGSADGQLEGIVLDDDVEVGGERDSGDAPDGLGFGEVERPGVDVGEEDVRDVEAAAGRGAGGVVLVDLEAERVRGQRGEAEEERAGTGGVGELGGEGALGGDGERAGGEGERRVEGVRGAGAGALAEGGLVAVAELVLLPGERGGGGEQQEEEGEGEAEDARQRRGIHGRRRRIWSRTVQQRTASAQCSSRPESLLCVMS